jgi:hypothetical protein
MPTDREQLERLRKLKRLRELQARSQPEQPKQEFDFSTVNPMTDVSFMGVTPEDLLGVGSLAQNIATELPSKIIGGLSAAPDVLMGEGQRAAQLSNEIGGNIRTDLSPEGEAVAGRLGEGMKDLMKHPAMMKLTEMGKEGADAIAAFGEFVGASMSGNMIAPTKQIKGIPQTPGSPAETFTNVGGAIGKALPKTLMESAALFAPETKLAALPSKGLSKIPSKNIVKAADEAIKTGNATEDVFKPIADTIKKGTPKELADLVKADPAFYKAADELGINVEPLASFASKNPQFVSVEAGLASVPSSVLDVQAKAFISSLSTKADEIIETYGGTLDKAQMNIDFPRQSMVVVDDLAQQADDVYGSIAKILPKSNKYPLGAGNTVDFIKRTAIDLGGVDELPNKLKGMLKSLKGSPTLGKIDQLRREVGQALNKKSGPFKNSEHGQLKALYGRLASDQDLIAVNSGLSNVTDSAKALIIKRKQIEDNLVTLLGKDLNKPLSKAVGGAIKGLSKSEIGRFKEVINAIPKKYRGEAIMTSMNDVFKGVGPSQQSLSAPQFVKWYETLNRSPAAKSALFKELPKESAKAIDNLYKVSKGVSNYLGEKIHTGRLNALFNEKTGFLRRLVGRVAPSAVAVGTGSPVAAVMTSATMDFIKQSTNGSVAASNLLASPRFQGLIKQAAKDGSIVSGPITPKVAKIQNSVEKMPSYKKWYKTLNKEQKKAVENNSGLIGYLFYKTQEANDG